MLFEQLVNQSWKEPKKVWEHFGKGLRSIEKYYKDVDPKFKEGLYVYSTIIENGYGTSTRSSKGYDLSKEWIIKSFISTFDPLLNETSKSNPFLTSDLANDLAVSTKLLSKENLLKQCLTLATLPEFAERFESAQQKINQRIFDNGPGGKFYYELIIAGETLKMLGHILHYLKMNLPEDKIEWCSSCFRRANPNSRYCPEHAPRVCGSNRDYKKYRDWPKNPIIHQNQSLRRLFLAPENLKIISNSSDYVDDGLLRTENYLVTNNSVTSIVESTKKNNWTNISNTWDEILKNVFPKINVLVAAKASSFNSWQDFINYVRIKLNEKIEVENHPLWVIYELHSAEIWFESVKNLDDYQNKKDTIIELHNKKICVEEIKNIVGLKKSRIYQIIKENKK